jgi:membrane protease YdiL (CAAX protease family)
MLFNIFADGLDFYKSIFRVRLVEELSVEQRYPDEDFSFERKLRLILIVTCFSSIFAFGTQILNSAVQARVGISPESNTLIDSLTSVPILSAFVMVVFAGPLIEEVAFRLWLTNSKPSFIGGLYLFAYYIGLFLSGLVVNLELTDELTAIMGLAILVLLFGGVTGLLFIKPEKVKQFADRSISWMLVVTIVTFAAIHFLNFDLGLQYLPLIFILTLPQLSAGFVFGYLKLRFGFWTAVVSHGVQNFILSIAFFAIIPFLSAADITAVLASLNSGDLTTFIDLIQSADNLFFSLSLLGMLLVYVIVIVVMIWYGILLGLQSRKKLSTTM